MHGRLILPALRWRDDTGFDHEAEAIASALRFGAGGFILFGGKPEVVRALTADLRERAGRPLLIAADLERGAGQQFPRAHASSHRPPHSPHLMTWAPCSRRPGPRRARRSTWASIGCWRPTPTSTSNPLIPSCRRRSFGADPATVGVLVANWVRACQDAGALACIKHFPGHGRTTRDSHDEVPLVSADLATLEATDLVPFGIGVLAKVATVMTGHLRVPALDPTGTPATFSAPILRLPARGAGLSGLDRHRRADDGGRGARTQRSNPSVRALVGRMRPPLLSRRTTGGV